MMQLPGFVYSALIVGLVAFLQVISGELQSLTDWWAPAAVLLVAGALKALEAHNAKETPAQAARSFPEPARGFWERFWLG